jgi:hypothetical protein
MIPNTSPSGDLVNADSVALWMDNQKNGQRGATIHHTACPGWFCPVKALSRRVHAIVAQGCPNTTPLRFVSPGLHVVAGNITTLVHRAALKTNLGTQGYDLKRVSTHSLRASGAMALKLQGVDDSLIMKIGCWTGEATKMAVRVHFINVVR